MILHCDVFALLQVHSVFESASFRRLLPADACYTTPLSGMD